MAFLSGYGGTPILFSSASIPSFSFSCLDGYLSGKVSLLFGQGEIIPPLSSCNSLVDADFCQDGSYALFKRHGASFRCGTDFFGSKKIYYYYTDRFWLVSTSFSAAVSCLRGNGIVLKEDSLWRTSRLLRTSIGNQLISTRTSVSGLNLLPQGCFLDICLDDAGRSHQVVVREYDQGSDFFTGQSYRSVLSRTIAEVVVEVSSLIQGFSGIAEFDLSGGRDSRLSFCLGMASLAFLDRPNNFLVNSNRHRSKDYLVVSRLLRTLSIPETCLSLSHRATGLRSFSNWIDFSLGVYRPVYFTDIDSWDSRIRFGGGGGEIYRQFYKYSSLSLTFASAFPRRRLMALFSSDMIAVINELSELNNPWRYVCSPSAAHYRMYRARFHGARTLEVMGQLQPLMSRSLFHAWCVAVKSGVCPLQFYADLLFNLCPDACQVPFDCQSKDLTARQYANVADVRTDVRQRLSNSTLKNVEHVSAQTREAFSSGFYSERECFSMLGQVLSSIDVKGYSSYLSISASLSQLLSLIDSKSRSPRSVSSVSLMDVHDLLLCHLVQG